MTHRERVQAALNHEPTDRCPMQISFTPEFAERLQNDLSMDGRFHHNPHGGGNTYNLERALDEDMLLTSVGWANSYYAEEADTYMDEWGIGWRKAAYDTPFGTGHYTDVTIHPLAKDDALSSYMPPDPHRDALYQDAQATLARYGDKYWIVGVTVTTIFETAWALRGLSQMLEDFLINPELAHQIVDIPFQYHLTAAKNLTEMGVDMIWTGDDVGTQTGMIMSPEMWRTFLKPRMAQFFAELKAINPDVKIAYHSDGDIRPIIPDLIEIGLDVLNPIQPACMDLTELARDYGDKLCFWGSIDEQHTLPFGSPDDVRREVRERIATLGKGGGLILGPTHHVQLDTPLENFLAMHEEILKTAVK